MDADQGIQRLVDELQDGFRFNYGWDNNGLEMARELPLPEPETQTP